LQTILCIDIVAHVPEKPYGEIQRARPHPIDNNALRALAHPLRIQILDELSMYGPLTASSLGSRLGQSSGSTSYHLRQLAGSGLIVEEAGRGTARERWWARRPGSISTPDVRELAAGSAERLAAELVEQGWMRGRDVALQEYLRDGESIFGPEWLKAASFDTINLPLTAEQLALFVADIDVVIRRYLDLYKNTPSPGSQPVQLQLNAFPLARKRPMSGDAESGEKLTYRKRKETDVT
jgi:DNA-binding transcriptional ArsR family regulator